MINAAQHTTECTGPNSGRAGAWDEQNLDYLALAGGIGPGLPGRHE